ncbi:MAG: transglutaminase family protein, partial [Rhizobiaceae bacterium]|nr:transglutaminase family protein [Rhizobiaceae bacterium]
MSIKASIYHLTHYKYDKPVILSPQVIRLRPAPHSKTKVLSHSLRVSPEGHFVNLQQDPYGNYLARYVFPEPVTELKIEVDLVADMTVYNPFDFFVEESAEMWPFAYPEDLQEDLSIYMRPEPPGPRLQAFLDTIDRTPQKTVDLVVGLNQELQQKIGYVIRLEPGVQSPEETLASAMGSCRDTGWLLVQTLRHLGLATRFVSGYLIQLAPDIKSLDGPSGTEVDFTDLHAWCEVYIPGAGWIGLDPTSGLLTGESHIPLAATPHYRNAAPITGGFFGQAETDFAFDMTVMRVSEHPRITRPFPQDSWEQLDRLGGEIDAYLAAEDVRLTMGGEPTFVSIDDYQSAEWNTTALGPQKFKLAGDLIERLRTRFAPGALLHFGQGKWYPGEELPRWAYSLYWRRDGQPIWQNMALIARGAAMPPPTSLDAQAFTEAVAARLGLKNEFVQPLYEDPVERLVKEGALPANVDPSNPKIDDPAERNRIMRTFERALTYPSGFVLPVQHWTAQSQPGWLSEIWQTRRGRLFLIPGDSPVGLRLPLASLPYFNTNDYPHLVPADPFDEHPPLAPTASFVPRRQESLMAQHGPLPMGMLQGSGIPVRTAIAVEVRDGKLCVFMPPAEKLEYYLELLAAIEATAAEKKLPVHIEGYPPPNDPRINVIKVTPDPGVIEVNVQPASSWREAVDITRGLYEDAHYSRLGTDKFMIDG